MVAAAEKQSMDIQRKMIDKKVEVQMSVRKLSTAYS